MLCYRCIEEQYEGDEPDILGTNVGLAVTIVDGKSICVKHALEIVKGKVHE
jgi:hypothetical protein